MTSSKYPKNVKVGDIVQIPIGNDYNYGRVLKYPLMAFYFVHSGKPLDCEEILKSKIAFKLWVMKYALMPKSKWKIIGHAALEPEHEESPWFFKQDPLSKKLSLYRDGTERPAKFEECASLERAAVWDPEHVESRLADHLAGRENMWVESLRLKK